MSRLLIIKPSSLGDIVHGLQLAATLQAHRPELEIDWVARDVFAPLVEQATVVRRVYRFARNAGVSGFWRLVRQLRATAYEDVFDLQGLLRSGLMTAAAQGERKVGRRDAREGARWFFQERVALPATPPPWHALDILLQFAPLLGVPPRLAGRLSFRAVVSPQPEDVSPSPIVLFPDSRRPEKCWPGFTALTERLLRSEQGPVVWAGSACRTEPAEWPRERFANLTGQTPLAELPALLGRARLVVANDSGPLHLAAAMGVPVVALFGPTDPRRYGPYPLDAAGHHVLTAPGKDLAALTVERVAAAIQHELARAP